MNSIQALERIESVIDGPEAEYFRGWSLRDKLEHAQDYIRENQTIDTDAAIAAIREQMNIAIQD